MRMSALSSHRKTRVGRSGAVALICARKVAENASPGSSSYAAVAASPHALLDPEVRLLVGGGQDPDDAVHELRVVAHEDPRLPRLDAVEHDAGSLPGVHLQELLVVDLAAPLVRLAHGQAELLGLHERGVGDVRLDAAGMDDGDADGQAVAEHLLAHGLGEAAHRELRGAVVRHRGLRQVAVQARDVHQVPVPDATRWGRKLLVPWITPQRFTPKTRS